MDNARIHVERAPGGMVGRMRAYRIMIDGVLVGEVKRGGSRTIDADWGYHEFHLAMDWTTSPSLQLELAPGGEVRVRCWSRGSPLSALYWLTFGRLRAIGIELHENGGGGAR